MFFLSLAADENPNVKHTRKLPPRDRLDEAADILQPPPSIRSGQVPLCQAQVSQVAAHRVTYMFNV